MPIQNFLITYRDQFFLSSVSLVRSRFKLMNSFKVAERQRITLGTKRVAVRDAIFRVTRRLDTTHVGALPMWRSQKWDYSCVACKPR